MKIILIADDTKEPEKVINLMQANRMQTAIWDYLQELRDNYKYKEDDPVKNSEDARTKFIEILEENNIIWDL